MRVSLILRRHRKGGLLSSSAVLGAGAVVAEAWGAPGSGLRASGSKAEAGNAHPLAGDCLVCDIESTP